MSVSQLVRHRPSPGQHLLRQSVRVDMEESSILHNGGLDTGPGGAIVSQQDGIGGALPHVVSFRSYPVGRTGRRRNPTWLKSAVQM